MDNSSYLNHKNVDWKKLKLRCGVEIHQQLLTEKKLFCRCPAGKYTDVVDAKVLRHMRPTLSELGEYDGTALMEFKTKKNIVYLLDRSSVCTYEMDDTPPFQVNREALDIAIEICMNLECKIVGEIHVIRKQYLDGSIPTGFQRTAIIGVDGKVKVGDKEIGIIQVSVEEDSCREVSDKGHNIVFRTDRLSMPLVEVVTEPQMYTPEEAATVVKALGRIMRSTKRVRRGAGASRQDVNVSVEGGTRIEIKGVPSISIIPALVGNEGLRQRSLLDIKDKLALDGISKEKLDPRIFDTSHIFDNTKSPIIKRSLEKGHQIKAIRLKGMRSAMNSSVGANRNLIDEISGRIRVIACIDEEPIIISYGNHTNHGISGDEWRGVRRRCRSRAGDSVLLLRGPEEDMEMAMQEVIDRTMELFDGIPSETRQVLDTHETDFERILPGPDRMYPDTDSPPIAISTQWLYNVEDKMREPIWDIDSRLREMGLPEDIVDLLGISDLLPTFDKAVGRGVKPMVAGELLTRVWRGLGRKGLNLENVSQDVLDRMFEDVAKGNLISEALPTLLEDAVNNPHLKYEELTTRRNINIIDEVQLKSKLAALMSETPDPITTLPEAQTRYYMGHFMPKVLGSTKGSTVLKITKEMVGNK